MKKIEMLMKLDTKAEDDVLLSSLTTLLHDPNLVARLGQMEEDGVIDTPQAITLALSLETLDALWWTLVLQLVEAKVNSNEIAPDLHSRVLFGFDHKHGFTISRQEQSDGTFEIWLAEHTDGCVTDECAGCPGKGKCDATAPNLEQSKPAMTRVRGNETEH